MKLLLDWGKETACGGGISSKPVWKDAMYGNCFNLQKEGNAIRLAVCLDFKAIFWDVELRISYFLENTKVLD